MKTKSLLLIVQPFITAYRAPVFKALAQDIPTILVCGKPDNKDGFGETRLDPSDFIRIVRSTELSVLGKIFYQTDVIASIFKYRPTNVLIFANPRYVSFWLVLLIGKLTRTKVFCHGHGSYKIDGSRRAKGPYRLQYRIMLTLAFRYICYNNHVKESLIKLGMPSNRLLIAENSFINNHPITPNEKSGKETGILFIGRLRDNNKLMLLIDSLIAINNERHNPIKLHIIGHGPNRQYVIDSARIYSWIKPHGQLYDHHEIAKISLDCFAGCYPGNVGLSILHFMSLSLVPVTHNMLNQHGPEASYINDGINGLFFKHNSPAESLQKIIKSLLTEKNLAKKIQGEAFSTYLHLTTPPLEKRLLFIFQNFTENTHQ